MQKIDKNHTALYLVSLVLLLIWGIVSVPSWFSPYWCYLDDPYVLSTAKKIATNLFFPTPDGTSGRYVPAYWLYFAVLYNFFEFNLFGYYLIHSLVFLIVLILGFLITKKSTTSNYYGILTVSLLATASPIAENLYTLGKPELNILFYLFFAIWLSAKLLFTCHHQQKIWSRKLQFLLIFFLVLIALLTKETAIVFFVFGFSGFFILKMAKDNDHLEYKNQLKLFSSLSVLTLVAFAITKLLFFTLRPKDSFSNYTSYPIDIHLILGNLKFYITQQPDVLLLCVVSAMLLGIIFFQNKERQNKKILLANSLFFASLAYISIHLLWRWPLGYYLLVPAAFLTVSFVIALHVLLLSPKNNKLAFLCVSLVLLTRVYSISYLIYIAQAQTSKNQVYSEAVEYYVANARPGERLLVEDWPFYIEPVTQTNIFIKDILQKDNLKAAGIHDLINKTHIPDNVLKLYNFDQIPDNKSRFARKGDYLLAFRGNNPMPWILRGVTPFVKSAGSASEKMGIDVSEVSASDVQWKGIGFSTNNLPVIETYSNGYTLYKVNNPIPKEIWEGRWSDKWIGKKAKCSIRVESGQNDIVIHGVAMEPNIPLRLTIAKDNLYFKEVEIKQPGLFDINLKFFSADDSGVVDIGFEVDTTFNPKKRGMSADDRELGIIVEIVRESSP